MNRFLSRLNVKQIFSNADSLLKKNETLQLSCRVKQQRKQKQHTFLKVNDGSSASDLQIVLPAGETPSMYISFYVPVLLSS
jgi:aspartyl/asparaginyl-tRNA synthetase